MVATEQQSTPKPCGPDNKLQDQGKGVGPDPHLDQLLNSVNHLVNNDLPIYLIYLPKLELVKRDHVRFLLKDELSHHRTESLEKKQEIVKNFFRYAIFSHRWTWSEPQFDDIRRCHPNIKQRSHTTTSVEHLRDWTVDYDTEGGKKLLRFMQKAEEYGLKFAWSDTCCINKDSSAELQESLVSMFRWYRKSEICIVHLGMTNSIEDMKNDEWFKRGWTLQELLAPHKMRFYNQDWKPINNYEDPEELRQQYDELHKQQSEKLEENYTLAYSFLWDASDMNERLDKGNSPFLTVVAAVTNISLKDLRDFNSGCWNIGTRFNWASSRTTTRDEDMAYSLMGIFDVQPSINYGEGGEKAFFNLQVEVMKRCCEMSLFAWNGRPSPYNSMLAAEPACFKEVLRPRYENSEVPWVSPDVCTLFPIVRASVKTDLELSNRLR